MIDAFAILISCFMLAFVVIRAIKLDARLPWFEPLGGKKPALVPTKEHDGGPQPSRPDSILSRSAKMR